MYTDSSKCDDPNDGHLYASKIREKLKANFKEYELEFEVLDSPHIHQYEVNMPDGEAKEVTSIEEDLSVLLSESWEEVCDG